MKFSEAFEQIQKERSGEDAFTMRMRATVAERLETIAQAVDRNDMRVERFGGYIEITFVPREMTVRVDALDDGALLVFGHEYISHDPDDIVRVASRILLS